MKIEIELPNETSSIMYEILDITKVFPSKEELVKYISQ